MLITEVYDILEIVAGKHPQPHEILGMHKKETEDGEIWVARVFMPYAKQITLIDQGNKRKKYVLDKIHEDGFFEGILAGRDEWFQYQLEYVMEDGNTWKSYDPYSFGPAISEYDRYLFGAGNHYEIYKKMGGRLMSHEGVKGAAFTVWAPNAQSISLVGDFNHWDTRRNPMRRLGTSGVWEIFIPKLTDGDAYKYHIVQVDGRIVDKTDPYGYAAEVRPNTASVLYADSKFKWKDKRWLNARKKKDMDAQPMNVYEVHLGTWMRVPEEENRFLTYTELAERLVPYVKEMGFNFIELMPVSEHPFDGSWGYQVTGFYAPTSRFGHPDEFKHFIDTCHNNGIGVILDWVPAHFPKDDFALARFDGTALYEHQDPRQGEHKQWGTYIFNYDKKEVSNFLIGNALFWLEAYHLDGLRVDAVASMLYLDFAKEDGEWLPNKYGGSENIDAVEFLKHLNSIIREKGEGALMIAEESTSWAGVSKDTKEGGLGFNMKWNMGWMNDFLFYMKQDPMYRKFHHNKMTFGMAYHYTENFMLVLSHDEVVHEKSSMVGKMPGDDWQRFANLRLGYGFMYGHPGKKLLFMGGEFGQYHEWDDATSLDWHLLQFDDHKETQNYMKALNHFYTENDAMWAKDFDPSGFAWIEADDCDNSVFSFIRRSDDKELYFVCNFTPNAYDDFRLGVQEDGEYVEVFNSDLEEFGGSGVTNAAPMVAGDLHWNRLPKSITLRVPPLGMVVLERKIEKVEKKKKK